MRNCLPIVPAVLLVILASSFFGYLAFTNPRQLNDMRLSSSWLGADLPDRFSVLTDRNSTQAQAFKHPLFPLLHIPVLIIHKVFYLDYPNSIAVLLTLNVALWTLLVFNFCYYITGKVVDGCIYTLLSLTTASSFFWLPVTETYAFGSTSILIPLFVVITPLLSSNVIAHSIAFVCAAAMTVTNAMVAIMSQVAQLKWRGVIIALLSGVFLLLSANLLQKSQFPHSDLLLNPKRVERDFNAFFIRQPELRTFLEEFFLTPLTPAIIHHGVILKFHTSIKGIRPWPPSERPIILTKPLMPKIQYLPIYRSSQVLYVTLLSIWVVLLLCGVLSTIMSWRDLSLLPVLLTSVLGQFVLHLIYGPETFIYSLHWMPLMVMISATNSRHRWRYVALIFAIVLVLGCAFCNFTALSASRQIFTSISLDILK